MEEPQWALVFARVIAGESIRSVAVAFGTNPRRIRRALARAGLRAGGIVVGARGVPALAPQRSRLGTTPDALIAKAAGVTPEAVQGERRRLGIAAYRPARRPAPPPIAPRILPPSPAPLVRPPPSQRGHDPVVVRKSPRDGDAVRSIPARLGVTTFRANEPAPVAVVAIPVFTPRPRTEREQEVDRLLSVPRRGPDERKRIIRAETRPFELVSSRPGPTPAVQRRPSGPTWRAADPAVLRELAARAEAEPGPVRPPPVATVVVPSVATTSVSARAIPVAPTPAPTLAAPPLAPVVAPDPVATPDPFGGVVWAVHFEGLNEIVHICAADVVQALAAARAWLPPERFAVVAIEAV